MKKILLLILFLSCRSFIVSAQDCNIDFLGTKTLYKNNAQKYTPAPNGYQAVFINHVGRHGARHLTKDVGGTLAYNLLQKADSAKALKADGIQLKNMVLLLQKIEKPVLKSISIRGGEEQQGIGQRIMANYGSAFANK